ncbi:MAG: DUF393 domain-containing protein [Chromatiales bacterium]|nr:DUF393 domain-containing protein [Gammaproteobacteria bacterium]MCP5351696.1 DUF393 domain-containing protein [Chromatiales bacterium]
MPTQTRTLPTLTVFFDGGCPLCSREIDHYRRIERRQPGAPLIRWADITAGQDPLGQHGISLQEAMTLLHAIDTDGVRHVGAPAFVQIWSRLPYYHLLARTTTALRLTGLLDIAYRRFASWRYRRRAAASLGECVGGVCPLPGTGESLPESEQSDRKAGAETNRQSP